MGFFFRNIFLVLFLTAISWAVEHDHLDPSLAEAVKIISDVSDQKVSDDSICQACQTVVDSVLKYRRDGASREAMKELILNVCFYTKHYSTNGCKGRVDIMLDPFLFMMDNKKNMTAERICAIYFQENKCVDRAASMWEIPLPPLPKNQEKKPVQDNAATSTINILHLTDFHYDPLYKNGSDAVCSEDLCCQSGIPSKPENAAGLWGDYRVCDMPTRTVHNVLKNIKNQHLDNIEYVYFTGDIISHRMWDTTRESNSESIETLLDLFEQTFQEIPVYPIFGNHESHPADMYAPLEITQENLSTKWLFELAAEQWSRWLPEDTKATILKGGYYTVMTKRGYRIIALNSNVCFTNNCWLFYEDKDPYGQLAWLVEELAKAEKNNEKVHILSHIPPGERTCHRQWSYQFRQIVNRFAGTTIAAQFNGHTHVDEFRVFVNPKNTSEVTNVAFNGGGLTTFVAFNSNYKIYQVDTSTANVQDYDQYIFNLTRANEDSTPEWYKLYSFKEAYGLPDLKHDSLEQLLYKLATNEDFQQQYFRFLVKTSDAEIKEGCDKKCLKRLICHITSVDADTTLLC